jgi:hypothetical protein
VIFICQPWAAALTKKLNGFFFGQPCATAGNEGFRPLHCDLPADDVYATESDIPLSIEIIFHLVSNQHPFNGYDTEIE